MTDAQQAVRARKAPPRNANRARAALWYLAGAALAIGFATAAHILAERATTPNRLSGLVLPDFAQISPQVTRITIATNEGNYSMVKQGQTWIVPERGGYPAIPDSINQLSRGLEALSYRAARTSDPDQHGRLGVADPAAGGDGALLSVLGASGPAFASLFIGMRGDDLYIRKPGSNEVFLAEADLPPLRSPAQWLDLNVIEVLPEQIATVSVALGDGTAYDVVRRPDGGLGPVGGVPNVNATTSALALTKWRPIDVAPAAEVAGTPVFTHKTVLRTAIEITASGYERDGRGWIKISASSTSPEGQAVAAKINARATGWAFALTPNDFADYNFSTQSVLKGPEGLGQSGGQTPP
jgi:Domain of unknown function (DUF4340)